jgi:hypothetical protein
VIAVLRLVVDAPGGLAHGEVVTASCHVAARFRTWTGLANVLQSWVAGESADPDVEETQRSGRARPDPRAES